MLGIMAEMVIQVHKSSAVSYLLIHDAVQHRVLLQLHSPQLISKGGQRRMMSDLGSVGDARNSTQGT